MDVLVDPRCDCRIAKLTGLPCRDCPRRKRPAPDKDNLGLEIPTFLRRAGNHPPLSDRRPDRCCED